MRCRGAWHIHLHPAENRRIGNHLIHNPLLVCGAALRHSEGMHNYRNPIVVYEPEPNTQRWLVFASGFALANVIDFHIHERPVRVDHKIAEGASLPHLRADGSHAQEREQAH